MGTFIQIVILLIILACMVMVLIGIRQLGHFQSFEDAEETSHLKEEVEDDGHILSNNNIFSTLVEPEPEKDIIKRHHKENSKEPFSPNE